jgi:ribosomal protein L37AE/L43A
MSDRPRPDSARLFSLPDVTKVTDRTLSTRDEKMLCERCHAEMYRMHAVWRCSACGFKTDCCGW